MLMDPHVMTGAVPGMQSIDVISPTEYAALMKVKISFISAKFKLNTKIVEQREPEYLRAEGTGEDASVASSLKQTTEVFLNETPEGGTELKIRVNVDLLGRLGTFGLSVMKTKADRMWDEFGKNLAQRIEGGPEVDAASPAPAEKPSAGAGIRPDTSARPQVAAASGGETSRPIQAEAATADAKASEQAEPKGWFSRLLGANRAVVGRTNASASSVIRVEIRQLDRTISVEWPVEAAGQCQEWLREVLAGRS